MGDLETSKLWLAPLAIIAALFVYWFAGEIQTYGEPLVTYLTYIMSGLFGVLSPAVIVEWFMKDE